MLFAPAAVCWVCSYSLEQVFRLHMKPEDLEKEAEQDAIDRQTKA